MDLCETQGLSQLIYLEMSGSVIIELNHLDNKISTIKLYIKYIPLLESIKMTISFDNKKVEDFENINFESLPTE